MARGGHGLPKVSLGPVMPYPSTPCRGAPLKQPYGCFRGGCPQGGWSVAIFYPLGHCAAHQMPLCLGKGCYGVRRGHWPPPRLFYDITWIAIVEKCSNRELQKKENQEKKGNQLGTFRVRL
jgi:hypothetical protein